MSSDTSSSSTQGDARLGQVLSGRYRLSAVIAEGRSSVVYLAEHLLMKKRCAVKILQPDLAADEEATARLRREAEAASKLDHPNIVSATDLGRADDGSFYLVMDFVDGKSLREVIARGPLPAARALKIAKQIALALGRAHRAGIIHRDVRPENILLVAEEDGTELVKVLDFGLARVEPANETANATEIPLTRAGAVLSAPEYAAPEQVVGGRASAASDLYAVGVVLFEMLAGRHPFDVVDKSAVMSMHVIAAVPHIAERAPNVKVSPRVEGIVRGLLAKDVKARPASAEDLVAEIDRADEARASARRAPATAAPASAPLADRMWIAVTRALASMQAFRARKAPGVDRAMKGRYRVLVVVSMVVLASLPIVGIALVIAALVRSGPREGEPSATLGVVGSGAASGAPGASSSPRSASSASPDKIRAAAAKGPAALEELTDTYPDDTALLRELAFAYDGAGRTSDALHTVERAARAGQGSLPNDVVRIVVRAATKFDSADEAFRLLEETLGHDGVLGLLELTSDTNIAAETRARASRSLAKPSVRANATDATGFIIDLKAAQGCEGKRQVLARSGANADTRALPTLRNLRYTQGCGSSGRQDCWKCLRNDPSLERTIRAVESRAPQ